MANKETTRVRAHVDRVLDAPPSTTVAAAGAGAGVAAAGVAAGLGVDPGNVRYSLKSS